MTSIDSVLKSAAPEAIAPAAETITADVARGRSALAAHRRRRRRGIAAGGTALAVCAAAVAVVVAAPAGHAPAHASALATQPVLRLASPSAAHARTHRPSVPRVQLVAYTGAQLPGFTVKRIPAGWHLSTSTSTALLVTRDGSTDNDPNDFAGKLAVLTSSVDQHGLGPGAPVTVDGQPGRISDQGEQMLTYNSPSGFGVNVQVPAPLHWSDAQIVAFAEGVTVTDAAVHGEG